MNRATEPNPPHERGRLTWPPRAWLWAAILVLLVTIVYWPALDNDFVNDDEFYVKNNPTLHSLDGLSTIWFKIDSFEQYYPLVLSTFWVEYHLWGVDPRGYHAVNFLLHAVAAVLIWRLLSRLAVPGAWLAAAIFAVHPVHVESVTWVHELKNVLSLVLALGSLLAYLRFSAPENPEATDAQVPMARGHWLYYALAFVLYVAALLAKTVIATMPAVLLVIFWWKRGRVTWRDAARTAPFFAVGLALSRITVWMEKTYVGASGQDWDFSLVERVLIAGRALSFYVGKLIWPHPLIHVYPRWVIDAHVGWQYLFPAAAVSVIALLWLARTRIGRGPLAAVLIFAGVLLPALGFFDLRMFRFTFVMNHFQYHACIALIALAAAAIVLVVGRLPNRARWFAPVAVAGLLLPLAVLAQQRMHVFKDNISAVEDLIMQDPQCWAGHQVLGGYLQRQGKYDEALPHFRKTVEIREQLARDNPTLSDYKNEVAECCLHVGIVQRRMGRVAEEESSFRKAIEIREKLVRDHPTVSDYQDGLASCYEDLAWAQYDLRRPADAEASCRKAIEIRQKLAQDNPTKSNYKNDVAAAYVDFGLLQRDLGRAAESESAFCKAIEIRVQLVRDHPTVAEYQASLAASHEDLAISQQSGGRAADAVASRRKAIEIREQLARGNGMLTVARRLGWIEIRQKLAQDNLTVGKYQDDFAASYVDLGLLQRDMGQAAEAQVAFRNAITIREKLVRDHPTVSDYQDGLAWCYVDLALAQHETGRPADAVASRRKAIELREKLAQDNPAIGKYQNNVAASYADLGFLQREMGRPAEAQGAFCKAIDIREKLVRDHPTASDYQDGLAWSYVDLALAQDQAGQPADAEISCRKAIEIRQKLARDNPALGDYQHQLAVSYRDLGNLQRATGRIAEALIPYRTAIEIREQLVRDYPTNATCQSNLAGDLALCGDALALLGRWSQSADLYARAVVAGNYSWQTMGRWALVQLAAGNEAGYRATCADLVRRHANNPAADAAFWIALTAVAGDKALDDMHQALALAQRAADADPSNPLASILVGAAEYRAGHGTQAIATLTGALSQLDPAAPSATAKPDPILVGRLVGEMVLALAYHEQADREALQKQLETLRELIDKTETPGPQNQGALPPWAVGFAVEIAKRELAKLSAPADAPPLGS